MLRSQYPQLSREAWDWSRIANGLADQNGVELARLVLDLVDSGSLIIHEGRDEHEVIARCLRLHPQAVWEDIGGRLAKGSWQIQMQIRGSLISVVPAGIIEAWVGDDARRAQLVASIAAVGADEPTPIARFLLERFGADPKVASSLWAQFISGFWWGPESERIAGQIEQLKRWRQRSEEPLGVRTWARDMIRDLEARRRAALEREAEIDL
jgi:hypothetical protein